MKICIACSAGGHLTEVLFLKDLFNKYDHFFVTFKRQDSIELSKKEKVYFIEDPKRNPIKLFKNIFQSLFIFLKEKPSLVISTGAGVVVPFCYFAKLFGSKIIFIESFCRTDIPSFSGKMIYPIADLFFVQWKMLSQKYGKKAIFAGQVI